MYRKITTRLRLKFPHWILQLGKSRSPKPYPIYPDDIFLVSYPRSGSSWLRRLTAIARQPECSEEIRKNINAVIPDMYAVGEGLGGYARPRMIKSHEHYQPLYPKVVYLYRDGRDVAVSYYNFYRTIKQYEGTLDQFLALFVKGRVDFGRWDIHVRSWMLRRRSCTFLAVGYEELRRNTEETLALVMEFLGHPASQDAIQRAVQECTFERHQEYVRNFSPHYSKGYRGGVGKKPGHWYESLSDNQITLLWDTMGDTLTAVGYRRNPVAEASD